MASAGHKRRRCSDLQGVQEVDTEGEDSEGCPYCIITQAVQGIIDVDASDSDVLEICAPDPQRRRTSAYAQLPQVDPTIRAPGDAMPQCPVLLPAPGQPLQLTPRYTPPPQTFHVENAQPSLSSQYAVAQAHHYQSYGDTYPTRQGTAEMYSLLPNWCQAGTGFPSPKSPTFAAIPGSAVTYMQPSVQYGYTASQLLQPLSPAFSQQPSVHLQADPSMYYLPVPQSNLVSPVTPTYPISTMPHAMPPTPSPIQLDCFRSSSLDSSSSSNMPTNPGSIASPYMAIQPPSPPSRPSMSGSGGMDHHSASSSSDIDLRQMSKLRAIKACACDPTELEWTHSSLCGRRDYFTHSGRLKVPSSQEVLLAEVIDICYKAGQAMSLVERQTAHYPYTDNIDVLAPGAPCPPDNLLHNSEDSYYFWRSRATILHQMFPQVQPLELVLYQASGWSKDKRCQKTSFHCVWPQLIVDMERAHVVRLKTIDTLKSNSASRSDPLYTLAAQLRLVMAGPTGQMPAVEDLWDTVFDVTAVRAGTLRMPYNDKWHAATGSPEGRPILPVAQLAFYFDPRLPTQLPRLEFDAIPSEKSVVHWVLLGTVRRPARTPLTKWVTPIPGLGWRGHQTPNKRSSISARRLKRPGCHTVNQQPFARKFTGTHVEMKAHLDSCLSDEEGFMSTLQSVAGGCYVWKRKGLKGAIHFTPSIHLITCLGNAEQKTFLTDLLQGWTSPWEGPVPVIGKEPNGKGKGGKTGKSVAWSPGQGKRNRLPRGGLGALLLALTTAPPVEAAQQSSGDFHHVASEDEEWSSDRSVLSVGSSSPSPSDIPE